MRTAIEHETLAALVETGAAREFRVLREGEGEGEAWRLELRLGSKWLPALKARTDQVLAFADGGGAVLRRGGDQGADGRALTNTHYFVRARHTSSISMLAISRTRLMS